LYDAAVDPMLGIAVAVRLFAESGDPATLRVATALGSDNLPPFAASETGEISEVAPVFYENARGVRGFEPPAPASRRHRRRLLIAERIGPSRRLLNA